MPKQQRLRGSGAGLHSRPGLRSLLQALPWISPALLLIIGVVFFPVGVMLFNSTRDISRSGKDQGDAGFDNFAVVFADPNFVPILGRTLVWVVVIVVFTVLLSLLIAQLLDKAFPGRKLVRLAVIVPWAASVVMTTLVIYYGLEPYFGIINKFLYDIGLVQEVQGFGWTKDPTSAFIWAMAVAIFVSLPFTTYTILAGLQTISAETLEAARMDGAGPFRMYFSVILPQLRGALSVAILINIINVFNSLPILRVMTAGIPGYDADTIMTMIYKYLENQHKIDVASALSVVAFIIVLLIVAAYVRIVKPMKEV